MGSEPEKATLLSHIYGAIAESRCSHLIGLIYDRIMCLSGRSSLTSSQTSAILSLLRLPYKNIPDSVSCADLCELVEKNFHAKYGTAQDKALGQKSAQKCAEDDEANIDELKVLGALNALRRSAKCCAAPASLRLIREENLIRTVLRQDRALRKLKSKLAEAEKKVDLLAAEYFAERCRISLYGENSECDSGCNTERSASPNGSTSKGAINRKKAAYATSEECACRGAEMRFAPVEGKKSDTERRTQRAPHSMSIMWMCNPSTSVALGVIDESAADLRGGSAANPNSSALTALSKRHTVDFVCCSVTLQKRNLPNNTQRCERHTATSRLTLSASEPFCNAARSSTARPLCRSEYVTVDVTVCRKGSTRTVRWAAKQSWSTTLSARAPLPHRKRVFLQRLELCPDLALDSNVHLEYKRLKTKKIVEYRMPLLWKVN